MWFFGEGIGWWELIVIAGMLIFWGGFIALAVWVILKLTGRGTGNGQRRDPLDIAKERYAKGEISREEFEQFRSDLS